LKASGNFKVLGERSREGHLMGLERWAEMDLVELWRFGNEDFGSCSVFSRKPQMGFKGGCDMIRLKKIPLKYWKYRAIQQSTREMMVAWIREVTV